MCRRQADDKTVQIRINGELAAEARGLGQIIGHIQHVLFLFRGRWKARKPVLGDDHVTGGTSHAAFAGPFQVEAVALSDIENGFAGKGVAFAPRSFRFDEDYFWQRGVSWSRANPERIEPIRDDEFAEKNK